MNNTPTTSADTNVNGSFRVPEGYFDEFCARILNHPAVKKPIRQHPTPNTLHPYIYRLRVAAAACVAGIVALTAYSVAKHNRNKADTFAEVDNIEAQYHNENNIDKMLDYVMYDNDDLYAYLIDY